MLPSHFQRTNEQKPCFSQYEILQASVTSSSSKRVSWFCKAMTYFEGVWGRGRVGGLCRNSWIKAKGKKINVEIIIFLWRIRRKHSLVSTFLNKRICQVCYECIFSCSWLHTPLNFFFIFYFWTHLSIFCDKCIPVRGVSKYPHEEKYLDAVNVILLLYSFSVYFAVAFITAANFAKHFQIKLRH